MKICSKCKNEKKLDQFYNNIATKDGRSWYCKECTHEFEKNNNKLAKEWVNSLKKECKICGEKRYWVLDFHHIDPSKKTMVISTYSISGTTAFETKKKRILKELEHCIIICANCHRDIHYQEQSGAYQLNKQKGTSSSVGK